MIFDNYTIKDVATTLDLKRGTIFNWIQRGWLIATPQNQRNFLIKRKDLKDFFASPPSRMTKGVIALIDRNKLKKLFGE
jgi:hypothetical protein